MINIIVAHSLNRVIGKDNKLIWRQSADLRRFKELTTGKTVVMGRKTYDSIGKPLPNRRNIVISRQTDLNIPGVEVVKSLQDAISLDSEIFILGGGEIYKQALELGIVDKIYVTLIHSNVDGDTYFPEISDWKEESSDFFTQDEKNQYDYSFINLIKNGY
jgi:dihydrofolate reductase